MSATSFSISEISRFSCFSGSSGINDDVPVFSPNVPHNNVPLVASIVPVCLKSLVVNSITASSVPSCVIDTVTPFFVCPLYSLLTADIICSPILADVAPVCT